MLANVARDATLNSDADIGIGIRSEHRVLREQVPHPRQSDENSRQTERRHRRRQHAAPARLRDELGRGRLTGGHRLRERIRAKEARAQFGRRSGSPGGIGIQAAQDHALDGGIDVVEMCCDGIGDFAGHLCAGDPEVCSLRTRACR